MQLKTNETAVQPRLRGDNLENAIRGMADDFTSSAESSRRIATKSITESLTTFEGLREVSVLWTLT